MRTQLPASDLFLSDWLPATTLNFFHGSDSSFGEALYLSVLIATEERSFTTLSSSFPVAINSFAIFRSMSLLLCLLSSHHHHHLIQSIFERDLERVCYLICYIFSSLLLDISRMLVDRVRLCISRLLNQCLIRNLSSSCHNLDYVYICRDSNQLYGSGGTVYQAGLWYDVIQPFVLVWICLARCE